MFALRTYLHVQIYDLSISSGDSWHLRRLDWCEEIGEPLMDEVETNHPTTS